MSDKKKNCTVLGFIREFDRLDYMTKEKTVVDTGNKYANTVLNSAAIKKGIDMIPHKLAKLGAKAIVNSPKGGSYVARGIAAYRESCWKKK